MRNDKRNILVTRALTGRQIEYARVLGLSPIIKPALEFKFPKYRDGVLDVINKHPKSEWIFTSTNGVKALEQLMKSGLQIRPELQLFAVGSKTQQALEELGLEAKTPVVQNAKYLAELIVNEGKVNSVLYFHGNLSREELANSLKGSSIEVIELEVYKTIINAVYLPDEPVEAALFYSPSAVEGFKRGTGFNQDLPLLFVIGPTTAGALRKETRQEVKIADEPITETLLRNVSDYLFKKEKIK